MVFCTLMKLSGLAPSLSHRPPPLFTPSKTHTHTANLHTAQTRRDATNKLDIECCLAIQRGSQTHTPTRFRSHTPLPLVHSRGCLRPWDCVRMCVYLGILAQQKRDMQMPGDMDTNELGHPCDDHRAYRGYRHMHALHFS